MTTEAQRQKHEQWLLELTAIPTAAGREFRVIQWIEQWVNARGNLAMKRDRWGNLIIAQTRERKDGKTQAAAPLYITAHLDHPAFVVRKVIDAHTIELEFRGGVQDAYFDNARIEIFDDHDIAHRGTIELLNARAKPFKCVEVELDEPTGSIQPGDVGRWLLPDHAALPYVKDGLLYTHACDDLAAVAAALATLDVARHRSGSEHVALLLTRAEEVGFIGAIAASKSKSVPKKSRLICLENSRSFPESPIGAGPILRVGDRSSVFMPDLTNRISGVMSEHEKKHADFKWQRKLMPGGVCEATTFSVYGYQSTCICLPLGNYHNMQDIDGVRDGKRPAEVGPEYISISDYHGMIEMLLTCAAKLDDAKVPSLKDRMESLIAERQYVLEERE